MKKIIFLLAILLQSCGSNSDNYMDCCINPFNDTEIHLILLDDEGNDLLDTLSGYSKSVNLRMIKMFRGVEGEEKEYDGFSGIYSLYEPDEWRKSYYLAFELTHPSKRIGYTTSTIIQWPDDNRYTFKADFIHTSNLTYACKNVWLDGQLVWKEGDPRPRTVVIVL
ncbi:MAG: hypothetical protein LBJ39_01355 [Tannerellaceae bacterium]|jgi:hypothetical protein|nr:hypothetical protein [Tannerellaceae bacterium]